MKTSISKQLSILFPSERNKKLPATLIRLLGLLFITLSFMKFGRIEYGTEIIMGCILSATNAFLGYKFIERAFKLDHALFIIFSLASMAFRFFMLILSIALILVLSTPHTASFIGAFMVSYTIFMFAEVYYINWKTDQLKVPQAA